MSSVESDFLEIETQLRNDVEQVLAAPRSGPVRISIEVAPTCPLSWLYAQPWSDRVFWEGRDDDLVIAGAGVADLINVGTVDDLRRELESKIDVSSNDPRYMGTCRFSSEQIAEEWKAFGLYRFVLPRIEWRQQHGLCQVSINIMPEDTEDDVFSALDSIVDGANRIESSLPQFAIRKDNPAEVEWCAKVDAVLSAFATTDLDKVVLARRANFTFSDVLDPFELLDSLRASTTNSFHALIGIDQGSSNRTAFITATPERLFKIDGRQVYSEAVAGTRARAVEAVADNILRDELLESEKDLREQAFVVEAIENALGNLTSEISKEEEPSSFNLANGRHLRTCLKGMLEEHVDALDVLEALHPTPAVGGTPTESAIDMIAECERFDRGLYAGPIGWIGKNGAEFAVGIRSGLVRENELYLYSGAGIVVGSEPQSEWHEIEQKLDDFHQALGLRA